jgi:hypothetical protein
MLKSWRSDGMVRDLEFGFSADAAAAAADHDGDLGG